jgi:hypothetical protein
VIRLPAAARARVGALLACALLLPLLTGCALYNRVFHPHRDPAACRERPFIGNTDSRPPLQVPAGMSAPDTRNAIKIPQLPPAPEDLSKKEPCLAQPPPFYSKPPAAKPAAANPGSPAVPAPPAATPPATSTPDSGAPAPAGAAAPAGK